jgi:hypothetical protein
MAEPVIETQDLTKDYWLGAHVAHALARVSVTNEPARIRNTKIAFVRSGAQGLAAEPDRRPPV